MLRHAREHGRPHEANAGCWVRDGWIAHLSEVPVQVQRVLWHAPQHDATVADAPLTLLAPLLSQNITTVHVYISNTKQPFISGQSGAPLIRSRLVLFLSLFFIGPTKGHIQHLRARATLYVFRFLRPFFHIFLFCFFFRRRRRASPYSGRPCLRSSAAVRK